MWSIEFGILYLFSAQKISYCFIIRSIEEAQIESDISVESDILVLELQPPLFLFDLKQLELEHWTLLLIVTHLNQRPRR